MSEVEATLESATLAERNDQRKKFTTKLIVRDLRFRKGSAKLGDPLLALELITKVHSIALLAIPWFR